MACLSKAKGNRKYVCNSAKAGEAAAPAAVDDPGAMEVCIEASPNLNVLLRASSANMFFNYSSEIHQIEIWVGCPCLRVSKAFHLIICRLSQRTVVLLSASQHK